MSRVEDAVIIENVRKIYGKTEALKGVTLNVQQGEIFGLLGANGAGKSTLIKILVGSSRLNGGKVEVLGLDPVKQAQKLRRQIGYMPQAPALYEDLSPRDNLRFFGSAHRLDNLDGRITEILDFTGLRDREKDPIYGFSGGMKQRISLACALVHKPAALFLDEPTAGVDPKLREAFWKHFRELAASGVTIFISTHLMDEALLCDKLAIMRDGIVLVTDTPKNILRRGETRVKIWHGGQVDMETVTNYPDQLPRILQKYQLDSAVSKIEIEEDTLETIVLNLINHRETLALQEEREANHVVHV
jgi:ABC-2 type transport system ATP-binding protein